MTKWGSSLAWFYVVLIPSALVQVYASTPFKLRKGLHKEAAKWISDRHRRDFRDRADVMPMLINHLTQAHEEARAQAMLAVLKVRKKDFLGLHASFKSSVCVLRLLARFALGANDHAPTWLEEERRMGVFRPNPAVVAAAVAAAAAAAVFVGMRRSLTWFDHYCHVNSRYALDLLLVNRPQVYPPLTTRTMQFVSSPPLNTPLHSTIHTFALLVFGTSRYSGGDFWTDGCWSTFGLWCPSGRTRATPPPRSIW